MPLSLHIKQWDTSRKAISWTPKRCWKTTPSQMKSRLGKVTLNIVAFLSNHEHHRTAKIKCCHSRLMQKRNEPQFSNWSSTTYTLGDKARSGLCFRSKSSVLILLSTAVHIKDLTLEGDLDFQVILSRRNLPLWENESITGTKMYRRKHRKKQETKFFYWD